MTEPLKTLARLLSARAGLRLDGAGQSAHAIVERAAARAGARDLEHYAADVAVGNVPLSSLVEETRIGETYFFREPHQLDFLKKQLFARRDLDAPPLRLWSAGCASGEEAYTLAMLADEEHVPAEILGTDISEIAVAVARRAEYPRWSLRGPQRGRAQRKLHRTAKEHFVVDDSIRRRVSFAVHNLVADAPPLSAVGPWDAILCRNVLIYFDRETQLRVLDSLASALSERGWLLLGSCDPPASLTGLEAVVAEEGVFYRRPSRSVPPPPVVAPLPPVLPRRIVRRVPPPPAPPPDVVGPPPPLAQAPGDEARDACLAGLEALELGEREAALRHFRKALYIDADLVAGEPGTAALFERDGDLAAAARGYRRALRLVAQKPADEEVPLASGATYGDISAHCHRMLATLENTRQERLS